MKNCLIKIKVMTMKCDECGSNNSKFDERMGERICQDCGLVLVTEMFEETTHILDSNGELRYSVGGLGTVNPNLNKVNDNVIPKHITTGLTYCRMVLASVSSLSQSSSLRERIDRVYMQCFNGNVFGKSSYEARACAVVFYVLKENGTPQSMNEIRKEFDTDKKSANRVLRKINSFYKNRINYSEVNPIYHLERSLNKITSSRIFHQRAIKVMVAFEKVVTEANLNKSSAYYPSICWITANVYPTAEITATLISEKTGVDRKCIYKQTKVLLRTIGYEQVAQLKGIEIEKIGGI